MGFSTVRALVWGGLAALLAAAFAWALWPKPIGVDIARIDRGLIEVTVEDEGITRVHDVYTVSAPTLGKMLRSDLSAGDPVEAGKTVVARFEPSDPSFLDVRSKRVAEAAVATAEAAVRLADAQVVQARAGLAFTRNDLARATELAARRTISDRDFDKARLDVANAEAALATAEASADMRRRELESARAGLIQPGSGEGRGRQCCIEVTAPVSGRVLKLIAESEQVVQPGAPLIEIGDPNALEIAVDFLSRDAVRIEPGAEATIDAWGGAAPLHARVRLIEPYGYTKVSALGIEEQRVRVVLDFVDGADARRRLGHGYRVVARVTVWRGDDVVRVPVGALFRDGERWAVLVAEAGRARLRPIEIGERTARFARVTGGLEPGETVILHPGEGVHDGVAVVARGP